MNLTITVTTSYDSVRHKLRTLSIDGEFDDLRILPIGTFVHDLAYAAARAFPAYPKMTAIVDILLFQDDLHYHDCARFDIPPESFGNIDWKGAASHVWLAAFRDLSEKLENRS